MVRGSGRGYPCRTSRLGNLPYRCRGAPPNSRRPVPRWGIGPRSPRGDDPDMLNQRREHFPGITMRSAAVAGLACAGIGWLAIGLVAGWVVFFTPLLERAASLSSRSPVAPFFGAAAWAIALTAPTCFLVLGIARLAGAVSHLLGRAGPRRPVHAMARRLPAGVESLPSIHLPDGRTIPDVVLGPHGIAFFEPLPPPATSRQVGGRWEARFSDGRWRPIENPLDRAAPPRGATTPGHAIRRCRPQAGCTATRSPLARSATLRHTAPTMQITTVAWLMCMRWRPRRVEDGVSSA